MARRPRVTARVAPAYSFSATPKQQEFFEAVMSGKYRYLAMGGSIRGTKTFCVIMTILALCRMFPGSRWAVVRKDLPTLRRNTIPSINKLRPSGFMRELNQASWSYTCSNGSELIIFPESLATDPDLDRWKGLEVNGFALEEANELAEKSWYKAIERAGSWIIPPTPDNPAPVQPPPFIFLTFNPAANWVKREFYDKWKGGTLKPPYYFLPATIFDNPYASDEYKESLKNMPEREYRRFVMGEWEAIDEPDQLIRSEWIWAARDVEPVLEDAHAQLGADIARFGNDLTVLARRSGNAITHLREHAQLSGDRAAAVISAFVSDYQTHVDYNRIVVDSIGVGSGVVDILRKSGYRAVYEFVSGAKPVPRRRPKLPTGAPGEQLFFRFYNLRAQAWWEFAQKLRLGTIALPMEEVPAKLVADLTAVRYEIASDRTVKISSKDDIKETIGRSTDYGDAVVMSAFEVPVLQRPNWTGSRSYSYLGV